MGSSRVSTSRCHDVGDPYLLSTSHSTSDDYAHSALHYFTNDASRPSPCSGVQIDGGDELGVFSCGLSLTLVWTPLNDPLHPSPSPLLHQPTSAPPQLASTLANPIWQKKTNDGLHAVVDITPINWEGTNPKATTALVEGATHCVLSMTVGALCLPHVSSRRCHRAARDILHLVRWRDSRLQVHRAVPPEGYTG